MFNLILNLTNITDEDVLQRNRNLEKLPVKQFRIRFCFTVSFQQPLSRPNSAMYIIGLLEIHLAILCLAVTYMLQPRFPNRKHKFPKFSSFTKNIQSPHCETNT